MNQILPSNIKTYSSDNASNFLTTNLVASSGTNTVYLDALSLLQQGVQE